jgi:hypothetical protein
MINRKTPDSAKLTLDQFRRLMWYANRQRNETGELFSMEDVIDQQLTELGYTRPMANSMILVTEAGFDVLDSAQPRKPSPIVRFKGIEHRFQAMLEANANLVWVKPNLNVPGKESVSIAADMFTMKKSIIDLRPTAYFFHREELTINHWLEPSINLIAEYCYVVCHEEKSTPVNVPESFGIIIESREGSWSKIKPAIRNNVLADRDYYLQMVLDRKSPRG